MRQVDTHDVFEDEGQGGLGVDDVMEGDDVDVLEFLEQGGLADGGERRALLLLEPDFLQRHHLLHQAEKRIYMINLFEAHGKTDLTLWAHIHTTL